MRGKLASINMRTPSPVSNTVVSRVSSPVSIITHCFTDCHSVPTSRGGTHRHDLLLEIARIPTECGLSFDCRIGCGGGDGDAG